MMPLAEDALTPMPLLSMEVPARLESVALLGVALRAALIQLGWEARHADGMELAVVEAANNVLQHGQVPPFSALGLSLHPLQEGLACELTDRGMPMPAAVLERLRRRTARLPDAGEPAESGYGLALMQNLVDEVTYQSREGANMLRLVTYR